MKSLSLGVFENYLDVDLGMWFSAEHSSAGLTVGIYDLRSIFQTKQFHDISGAEVCWEVLQKALGYPRQGLSSPRQGVVVEELGHPHLLRELWPQQWIRSPEMGPSPRALKPNPPIPQPCLSSITSLPPAGLFTWTSWMAG